MNVALAAEELLLWQQKQTILIMLMKVNKMLKFFNKIKLNSNIFRVLIEKYEFQLEIQKVHYKCCLNMVGYAFAKHGQKFKWKIK